METKQKRRLTNLLSFAVTMPLIVPAFVWISTIRETGKFADLEKAILGPLQAKTLWDWMELLLLPIILIGGALLLNRSRRNTGHENAYLEHEIATDRQKEQALQAYFDRMAELLLKEKLSRFSTEEVRNVAKIRTLTVLRGLDPKRKGLVLLFLKDSGLIDREAVIDLCGADLRHVSVPFASLGRVNLSEADLRKADFQGVGLAKSYLSGANLRGANLVGANLAGADLFDAILCEADLTHASLKGANLTGADLQGCRLNDANLSEADLSRVNLSVGGLIGANLRGANLGGARLSGADLSEADLSLADLSGTQLTKSDLERAKSLEGATLPDGTKHE